MIFPEWYNKLGLMSFPLTLCLIAFFTIFLERLVFFLKVYQQKDNHFNELSKNLVQNQNYPKLLRDEILSISLKELKNSYYRGIKTLIIIGSLSPMIGLLGTVLGIISSFKVIASSASSVAPNMIAEGLWQAMLTTSFALFIALPCLISAHLFKYLGDKKLEDICFRLNKLSISFELK